MLSAQAALDFRGDSLFLCGGRAGSGVGRGVWERVDDLAGTSVVELFARFVFDGVGVALQVVDVLAETLILFLQFEHLLLEGFGFFALMGESGEAVVPKDNSVGHDQGESRCGNGGGTAAPEIDAVLGSPCDLREPGGELRFLVRDGQLGALSCCRY